MGRAGWGTELGLAGGRSVASLEGGESAYAVGLRSLGEEGGAEGVDFGGDESFDIGV